jgi:uncharacterized membrane protein YhhN
MIWILLGLSVLFVVNFIYFEISSKPIDAFMNKGLASFGFILVFAYSFLENAETYVIPFAVLILLGLICGLLGDLYLAQRTLRPMDENFKIINSGILCFSMGHIFYLAALLMLAPIHYFAFLVSFIMTVIVIVGSKVLKFEMNISKYPSYFYSILIFLMIGQALGYGILLNFNMHALLLLLGAVLFGISDLILAPIYFQNNKSKLMIISNLATYYLAQILIALSIYYF